jgi:hypothetical protein
LAHFADACGSPEAGRLASAEGHTLAFHLTLAGTRPQSTLVVAIDDGTLTRHGAATSDHTRPCCHALSGNRLGESGTGQAN